MAWRDAAWYASDAWDRSDGHGSGNAYEVHTPQSTPAKLRAAPATPMVGACQHNTASVGPSCGLCHTLPLLCARRTGVGETAYRGTTLAGYRNAAVKK
jgi:hypothetical protein